MLTGVLLHVVKAPLPVDYTGNSRSHFQRAIAQVDVLAIYNTDVEIRNRVLSGAMDFIDVYKAVKPAQTPPAPVRSANGAASGMNISAMNEQQFTKLNEMLSRGAKVDMRY